MPVLNRLDPELLPVVMVVPKIDLADIPAARAALHAVFAQVNTAAPNAAVERTDHTVPGVDGSPSAKVRMFRPKGVAQDLPCMVWIQGGGYVLTSVDVDDQWCEEIAQGLQCVVVSVLWRRAPEHPFPAASDDCYASLLWAYKNAATLRIDASRLVIGGASSGGGAAAGVALRVRDRAEIPLAHQLLIYPMVDDRDTTQSSIEVTDPEFWNRKNNGLAWRAYLGSAYGSDNVSPYAAPARATSLAGLAPATVLTAELDLFRDEYIAYAQRLMHAGVPTELHVYPAAHHGFDRIVPTATVSRRFYADRDAALRRAFKTAH